MNIHIESKVSGKITRLEVRDKQGILKTCLRDIPNIIAWTGLNAQATLSDPSTCYAMESNAENWNDLPGTWNLTGNTVTRATGSYVMPSGANDDTGNEIYWYACDSNTGYRCHILARLSDTSFTVSGLPKTITGGTIRRYLVNANALNTSGYKQAASPVNTSNIYDDIAGTWTRTYTVNYTSPGTGYNLGSIILLYMARVKLPSVVAIGADDQLQFEYTVVETCVGRSQIYELGAESVGIPQKYPLLSIVGNGTYVDVSFNAGTTHFLAGDKLDLRTVTPKRFAISSAASSSTTFTIITAEAHGRSAGDSVTIENASLAGYNGVFVIASVIDAFTFTILNAANPGAMASSGTARLTTPSGFFDSIGLATIASKPSASVCRITSNVTGVPVDLIQIGGDPGMTFKVRRVSATGHWNINADIRYIFAYLKTNAKAVMSELSYGDVETFSGRLWGFDSVASPASPASPATDWTHTIKFIKNSGPGKDGVRINQFILVSDGDGPFIQMTFNTPFNKTTAQRLTVTLSKQIKRDIQIP